MRRSPLLAVGGCCGPHRALRRLAARPFSGSAGETPPTTVDASATEAQVMKKEKKRKVRFDPLTPPPSPDTFPRTYPPQTAEALHFRRGST